MENALAIAKVMGPSALVLGLSLLLYPTPWKKALASWEKDHLSVFAIACLDIILGLITINMYNDWTWNVWILVTVMGWVMLAKGVYYFLAPGSWIKPLLKVWQNNGLLALDGLVAAALGAALTYYAYLV